MIGVAHEDEAGYPFYVTGLLLVVMWAYGFSRLRFVHAAVANLAILAAYELVALVYKGASDDPTTFVIYNFFFLSANIIGLFTGYALERHTRNEFLQKTVIASERAKADRLLVNVLPETIASRLKENEQAIAEEFDEASVLQDEFVLTPVGEVAVRGKGNLEAWELLARQTPAGRDEAVRRDLTGAAAGCRLRIARPSSPDQPSGSDGPSPSRSVAASPRRRSSAKNGRTGSIASGPPTPSPSRSPRQSI